VDRCRSRDPARTTGRTGVECMRELFERDMSDAERLA
jgi:hypothetical protein